MEVRVRVVRANVRVAARGRERGRGVFGLMWGVCGGEFDGVVGEGGVWGVEGCERGFGVVVCVGFTTVGVRRVEFVYYRFDFVFGID